MTEQHSADCDAPVDLLREAVELESIAESFDQMGEVYEPEVARGLAIAALIARKRAELYRAESTPDPREPWRDCGQSPCITCDPRRVTAPDTSALHDACDHESDYCVFTPGMGDAK